ncbi:MAG: DNA polymerase III subunit delta [Alphaproteobacteria bacterium]|nr:DNA polymerase III subunit delta [Alphaproteobacteria bacterium]
MKIQPGRADAFLTKPPAEIRAVLLYGPDSGLVRERLIALSKAVAGDASDPFRISDLSASQLKDDPARLADEAQALSLTGGRRIVRITNAPDNLAGLLGDFLAKPLGEALVVVTAGELGPRSPLRKLFEEEAKAASLACYADEGQGLDGLITQHLGKQSLRITPEALALLAGRLGSDRLMVRSELDKLAIYMGGAGTVTPDDIQAAMGDGAEATQEELAMAVMSGRQAEAQTALERLVREGTAAVAILRSVARYVQRLHLASGHVRKGKSPEQAIDALRPPVFFKSKPAMTAQVKSWPPERLAQAMEMLVQAELDCKTSGMPAEAVCGRTLMQVTRAAPQARTSPSRRA